VHDLRCGHRIGAFRVFIHQPGEQRLVEGPPIDADAHRLVVFHGGFDDGAELLVLFRLEPDIARIDPIFGQRLGAPGMVGEQFVADIVKIPDQRHIDPQSVEPLPDLWHGGRRLVPVHGDSNDLRPGLGQGRYLRHRGVHIRGIGVGHRLHDDRRAAADRHISDHDAARHPAVKGFGLIKHVPSSLILIQA